MSKSLLKIKLINNNDIRVFKTTSEESIDNIFSGLNEFVKQSFKISSFNLQFKDEEEDLITIVDSDDLQEAMKIRESITRIYVVKTDSKTLEEPKENEKEEKQDLNLNEEGKEEKKDENNNLKVCKCGNKLTKMPCKFAYFHQRVACDICNKSYFGKDLIYHCTNGRVNEHKDGYDICLECAGDKTKELTWKSFVEDLNKDSKLKKEFETFLADFLKTLKESLDVDPKVLFKDTLKKYKLVEKHEVVQKFLKEKFNELFDKFNYLLKFIAQNVNPNEIVVYLDLFLQKSKRRCRKFSNNIHDFFMGLGRDTNNGFPFFGFNGNNAWFNLNNMFGNFNGNFNGNRRCHWKNKNWDKDIKIELLDENVTLANNSIVLPNQTLVKTWKFKNIGTKDIPKGSKIMYKGKPFNPMINGSEFVINPNRIIKSNEEFSISVVIETPSKSGKYFSKWLLFTGDSNKKFGPKLFISFNVVNNEKEKNNVIQKQENEIVKQNEKLLKKENKLDSKKEKLRLKREELLNKLKQLENESQNILENENENETKEEIIISDEIDVEIEETDVRNPKAQAPVEIDDELNGIYDDDNEEEEEEDSVVLVKDLYKYSSQLKELKSMGFNDEKRLKDLLDKNKGSIEQVINQLF